jgi:outer membrane lipoprotein SlyB
MQNLRTDLRISVIVLVAVAVGGCAAHPDPIIDTKGVDMEMYAQDWDECEVYTEEIRIAQGVAKGSATGAAVGSISGAIWGDPSRSAANGALYGGTRSGLDADREQQQVFKRCMSGRGYRVLN